MALSQPMKTREQLVSDLMMLQSALEGLVKTARHSKENAWTSTSKHGYMNTDAIVEDLKHLKERLHDGWLDKSVDNALRTAKKFDSEWNEVDMWIDLMD